MIRTYWLLSGLLFFSLSCNHTQRFIRSYPEPQPQELIQSLTARQAAVQGVNMEARATSWVGGTRVRGTVQMLALRDGRLRFEAEVPLQGTVAALAVQGGDFSFLDHQKHEFKKGPACPSNVASLLRIPLRPEEVAAILLGDAPNLSQSELNKVEWDETRGADVLVATSPSGSTLWLGFQRANPQIPQWNLIFLEGLIIGSAERWRVAYEDLEPVGGFLLPRLIRFAEPGKGFEQGVEIKLRERSINPTTSAEAFILTPPQGYRIVQTTCSAP